MYKYCIMSSPINGGDRECVCVCTAAQLDQALDSVAEYCYMTNVFIEFIPPESRLEDQYAPKFNFDGTSL